jgi:class 3 adenylate cyclase
MDRHNLPLASSADLDSAHVRDLEVQAEYGVRFLTYWFDPHDGTGICLVDAPDEESIRAVHAASHGDTPSQIITVDLDDVHAFLGRTGDPERTGTIGSALRTIMFTDLVDSTTIMQQMGHLTAMAAWDEHNRIVTQTVVAHSGRVVKNTGDGFLLSFTDHVRAVECATELQRRFTAYNEGSHDLPLRIRIGLNAGLPVERDGDLFGSAVNLAARVCGHAGSGQILASGVLRELCRASSLAARFEDRGRVAMKGFVNAVQLYEVGWMEPSAPSAAARPDPSTR